ncbi:HNH endonuclease signature motif containing protein [Hyphobacterium sp.]|uniref:HNH endonuclease signature motif containing protein n=1 Tax=Hyphobacterium sp. TaxID=2004662 RepID=UPI003BAC7749
MDRKLEVAKVPIEMSISNRSIKLLWSAAAGRCSFPDCWEKLTFPKASNQAPFTLGEMAHICGNKPGANRFDAKQTQEERDDYENLILLCPTHHSLIDKKENEQTFTVEWLLESKSAHEARVERSLETDPTRPFLVVLRQMLGLLAENEQAWTQYGPKSELARKQPNSDEAHAVWLSERLSTIVPNNRRLAALTEEHRCKFDLSHQSSIAAFLLHVKSYERWVADELPYSAVRRFPAEFPAMIKEVIDASS